MVLTTEAICTSGDCFLSGMLITSVERLALLLKPPLVDFLRGGRTPESQLHAHTLLVCASRCFLVFV